MQNKVSKNKVVKHQLIKSTQHKAITKPQDNVMYEDFEMESQRHEIFINGFRFYNFLK